MVPTTGMKKDVKNGKGKGFGKISTLPLAKKLAQYESMRAIPTK